MYTVQKVFENIISSTPYQPCLAGENYIDLEHVTIEVEESQLILHIKSCTLAILLDLFKISKTRSAF